MKLLDDPRVAFGRDGPDCVLMRGPLAMVMAAPAAGEPTRVDVPTRLVFEQRFPRVVVRRYVAISSSLWFSRGAFELTLIEFVLRWWDARRASREPIPRAWVR